MNRINWNKQQARKVYEQRQRSIKALMEELRAKLERDAQREDLTWASVGSLEHVEELLREINEFFS